MNGFRQVPREIPAQEVQSDLPTQFTKSRAGNALG